MDNDFACQKSIFDTFIENLRIFDESERNCGNLKIKDFPGEWRIAKILILPMRSALQTCKPLGLQPLPDGRYYFPSAYTSGKYGLTAHVAEPDFFRLLRVRFFDSLCSPAHYAPGCFVLL